MTKRSKQINQNKKKTLFMGSDLEGMFFCLEGYSNNVTYSVKVKTETVQKIS